MSNLGPDLWERVTARDALQAAWVKVSANGGSAGGDSVSLKEFDSDLFANLAQLRAELLGGTYRTGPFRKVSISKKKPGYRILTIPSIRDRVIHTSIAIALNPILEAIFEDCSFAYRPNRGVVHAVDRIEKWHSRGYDVVIEADIVSYFDHVDHEILLQKISHAISSLDGSPALMVLVADILKAQGNALGTPECGLAQGSPLSPLLANLYLDALDEEIEALGVKIVRFADDFVILCKSKRKAEKALAHCVAVLQEHNLRLHDDGTRIVSFDKGFDFIGYLFLRTLALKKKSEAKSGATTKRVKSTVTDEGIIELDDADARFDPGRRVLYLVDGRHQLTTRNKSFSVTRDDGSELISVPYKRVGRIEVGPGVQFSRNPVDLALSADIEFALIDRYGQTNGTFTSDADKRAKVQLAQAKGVLQPAFRAEIARRLVEARIRNQRTQLLRLNRTPQIEDVKLALKSMKLNLRKLAMQKEVEQMRGIEGASSAIYWPALGMLLDENKDGVFRRTRPALDSTNAAINYMTAILERDIRAALKSVSLHPGFAFLHASKDRHDGLIYDLMEPFRAPLTEGLVIYLLNARRLKPNMFSDDGEKRIEISPEGRRAIILGYEAAVAKRINKTEGTGKLGWRAMMREQAQSLVRAVLAEEAHIFVPYLMEA